MRFSSVTFLQMTDWYIKFEENKSNQQEVEVRDRNHTICSKEVNSQINTIPCMQQLSKLLILDIDFLLVLVFIRCYQNLSRHCIWWMP